MVIPRRFVTDQRLHTAKRVRKLRIFGRLSKIMKLIKARLLVWTQCKLSSRPPRSMARRKVEECHVSYGTAVSGNFAVAEEQNIEAYRMRPTNAA
jgi:hypothetical protein